MVNYQNGKIYKLTSSQTNDVYVGSTTQTLNKRLQGHKGDYKCFQKNGGNYNAYYKLLQYNDVQIYLLETCPCNSNEELCTKEQNWIDNTENCINVNIARSNKGTKFVDYKNGKIYKITSNNSNEIYIGSTAQKTLKRRLSGHKKAYKLYLTKGGKYITSFKIIQYDDYIIELLENYPCNSKTELESREGYWIKNTPNCVNKIIAGRTKQERYPENNTRRKQYRIDNKEKVQDHARIYYNENKDKINIQQRNLYDKNKEKYVERKKQWRMNNNKKSCEISKKYREKHKEYYNNKSNEWYTKNRNQYNQHRQQTILCECGMTIKRSYSAKHKRTIKHQDALKNKQTI